MNTPLTAAALAFALALALTTAAARAQEQAQDQEVAAGPAEPVGRLEVPAPARPERARHLELTYDAQNLSSGMDSWKALNLRGSWRISPADLLQGELSAHRRFGVAGNYAAIGITHDFDADWFASISAGAGDGAFYLPRYRVDAAINRKLLEDRRLVATLGVGYYDAPDGHSDRSLLLALAYYFDGPWIVEGGVRLNHSNPGSVDTRQHFVALTYGRIKADVVTVRYGWGGEGYLATGPATQLVNFNSREASVAWRHWLAPHTGVILGANRYSNPLYRRTGITIGIFHEF